MKKIAILTFVFVLAMGGAAFAVVSGDLQVPGIFTASGISTFENKLTSTGPLTLESGANGNINLSPNGTGIITLTKNVSVAAGSGYYGNGAGLTNVNAYTLKSATTTIDVSAATAPTSGQILVATSGTTAAWANGGLVSVTRILSGTTSYAVPAGITSILVEAVAGGGGGASVNATTAGAGGGGGSGGYFRVFINNPSGSYTVAVGTGGTGGASGGTNNGNVGTITTFTNGGTTYQANFGQGGIAIGGSNNSAKAAGGGAGGTVSTGAGLDIASGGSSGGIGVTGTANANSASGAGGSSQLGAGGVGRNTSGAGNNGTGYGAGGGGALNIGGGTAAGGNGTNGVIYIWEFK